MKNLYQSTLFLVAALMAFSILALMALVGVSSQGIDRISREEDQEIRLAMALVEDSYRLKVALERQMVGLRGYLAGAQPDLLRPWREGTVEFAEAADRLTEVLRDPEDRALLEHLRVLAARHQTLGQELIALKQAGRDAEAQALFLRASSPMKSEMVAAADALIAAQRAQVRRIHVEVNRVEDQVRGQLMIGVLVAAPVLLLLAASIAWRVWVPLRELAAASRAFARGHLEVRVPKRYDDEFGEVATAFNAMASEVERSLRSLRETNEELRRVDRFRDDFLSMVTHELKTPLTSIMGFAGMLERGSNGPLTDVQSQSLHKITANAARMVALVNDLLDSTAIRQGRLELFMAPTPYHRLVKDVVAQMQALAEQKGIRLEVEPPVEVTVRLDAQRIAQVITNLLSNALKFTPEGGRVTVRTALRDGAIVTEVADTGPGIAPEDVQRLFVPFSKLAQETGGTGLGLSISKAIVEGHGGAIGLTSEPGLGSTFYFALPTAEGRPA